MTGTQAEVKVDGLNCALQDEQQYAKFRAVRTSGNSPAPDANRFERDSKMRSLAFAVVIGSMALLSSGQASALPLAPASSAEIESNVLLVRDGCGRGMRYSNRRGGCVPDFDRDDGYRRGPPPRVIIQPAPGVYIQPAPRVVGPGCPRGMRFSNSRQACVW